ncbi:MAG TPA: hypothetical protein VEU52_02865 [Candidatus Limnocylindrales bacterium]|nr:hypothetical protein [Candidatus Limnocylindrales bacterium]
MLAIKGGRSDLGVEPITRIGHGRSGRGRMNARIAAVAPLIFALTFIFGTPCRMQAQDGKTKYPSMAPLDQYLMPDRDTEIALARSAAPEAISRDAKILVLGRHGYETAVEGKNGFVCLVERAWMSPFDSAEFWNPKIRGPLCYNPPAVQSILPYDYKRTELVLAGKSKDQMAEWMKSAAAKKELPDIEAGAFSYMMSKEAYLTDRGDHNMAHLMFYTPHTDGKNWGADVPNSPVMVGEQGPPEPYTLFLVSVGKWSDGTPAPLE